MQTKAPAFLYDHDFPTNIILGITLETDKKDFDTPSLYKTYGQISSALEPASRAREFVCAQPQNRIVTIEPILQFDLNEFVVIIRSINPQVVYIGYDNHNCHLPEPTLAETQRLIKELEMFTEVRIKSLRKAWYEEGGK